MWQNLFKSKIIWFLVIGLGVALRIISLGNNPQSYDMGTFHAWGNYVLEHGLFSAYHEIWSDYLPLPMLSFGLISSLSTTLNISFPFFFRVFWMIVESLLISLVTLKASNKKFTNIQVFSSLFLFLPLIANTGWWGQIDSIPALLTLLSLMSLTQGKSWSSSIAYALAVAIKPIMLIAGPVFLVLGYQKKALPKLLITGIITLTLSAIPAVVESYRDVTVKTPYQAFSFILNQSTYQSSMYPSTTVNALNIWSIKGDFWQPDASIVLGLTIQQWGCLMFGICALMIFRNWHKSNYDESSAIFVAGQLLLCFYTLTTRMHERHLLFALPLLLLGSTTIIAKLATYLLSFIYLANLWGAMYWVNNSQVWPFTKQALISFSWATVILVGVIVLLPQISSLIKRVLSVKLSSYLPEILLVTLALVLRISFLTHPSTMIFDEVYHSFTANEYLHNNVSAWEWWTKPPEGFAYEWTHPPLSKYGMVLGMSIFGENSFGWRIGSSMMGIISLIGLYKLTLILSKSKQTARLALFLASIEGLHLVQSRIGMNDTYMLAFIVWSFVVALKSNFKLSAMLFGLALASKWSAIYAVIPLAVIYYQQNLWPKFRLSKLLNVFRLILISFIIYLLTFSPFILSGHTYSQLIELHRQMWFYHTGLTATHDYQSTPIQWLAVARPVWYWVSYGDNVKSNIYAQGNPLLLWFGLGSFVIFLFTKLRKNYLAILLATIFTLPWVFSPRIMFFYHYLPTSFFLMIIVATTINSLPRKTAFLLLTLFVISFLILTPVYYGYPVSNLYWETLFQIFPTWK